MDPVSIILVVTCLFIYHLNQIMLAKRQIDRAEYSAQHITKIEVNSQFFKSNESVFLSILFREDFINFWWLGSLSDFSGLAWNSDFDQSRWIKSFKVSLEADKQSCEELCRSTFTGRLPSAFDHEQVRLGMFWTSRRFEFNLCFIWVVWYRSKKTFRQQKFERGLGCRISWGFRICQWFGHWRSNSRLMDQIRSLKGSKWKLY